MDCTSSVFSKSSTRIQWMWNSSADSFSKSEPNDWHLYSDVENMIIEEASIAGKTHAVLDDYHIDFEHKLQISNNDTNKQQPVKRVVCNRDDKRLRGERFMPNPVAPSRSFGSQYGFISPFIKEVVKSLNLTKGKLPSKDETIVPIILEKAVLGIIEEGKMIGRQREAEKMAEKLMQNKEAGIEEVWKCCARLYSLDSFLYRKLNEVMRLIGSEEHEQVWRSKVRTLGPFSLLLWDNPFNSKITKPGTILYRGAELPDDLIVSLKDTCLKDPKRLYSFQAFTSCSRNGNVAEIFGNVLFIMNVRVAFTANLEPFSNFPVEEEELVFPGVCFTIDRVEFDRNKNKHRIYLTLHQRHNRAEKHHLGSNTTQSSPQNEAIDAVSFLDDLLAYDDDSTGYDFTHAVAAAHLDDDFARAFARDRDAFRAFAAGAGLTPNRAALRFGRLRALAVSAFLGHHVPAFNNTDIAPALDIAVRNDGDLGDFIAGTLRLARGCLAAVGDDGAAVGDDGAAVGDGGAAADPVGPADRDGDGDAAADPVGPADRDGDGGAAADPVGPADRDGYDEDWD